jgi:hypothetical protein
MLKGEANHLRFPDRISPVGVNYMHTRRSRFQICSVLFLFGSAALPLSAQSTFGRISGTVTDPSGASIAGAKVTVRNTDTQAVRPVTTEGNGFYVADNLPIGPYAVEVNQPGFKRASKSGLQLIADGHLTVDFRLDIGDTTQSVDVIETNTEQLNTVSGELGHVVEKEQVDNLALNGRNYMELLTLAPGVTVTNPDTFAINTSLSATNQVVNGHRSNQNNITVDGLGNLDAGANGSLINNVSPDFLQEVKIQSSNGSAQYGRSAGAAFGIMTKNGTDQFHGAAFEYFRNDALDARNFFAANNTELRYNDFGWDLGGPVKKDKLFFFIGEEWKRLRQQAAPARTTLPTTAELQGDFSALLLPAKPTMINQPGTKTPFPGNIIPAALITPDGKAIGNVYKTVMPLAAIFSNQPVANNATFQSPTNLNYRQDIGRVDYSINSRHTAYARWIDDYNAIGVPNGPGGNIPITPELRDRPGKSALISETWVASPRIVNEAHIGFSASGQHYWDQGDTWQRTTQGFQFQRIYNSVGPYVNGIPDGTITSFASWNGPAKTLIAPTTEIEIGDSVSIIHGQHTIRTGVLVIRNRKDQNGRSAYDGSVAFNTSGNPNTTGYALADALLGNYYTYTEAAYDPMGHYRYTEPAAFVEDSWKVSRKLTINLGLRYEYMMAMYSTANNLSEFVPSLYNPAQAVKLAPGGSTIVPGSGNIYNGLQRVANGINPSQAYLVPNANDPNVLGVPAGAPRGMYPSQGFWSPRVGFAWAVTDKTVIRGGFGLFPDRIQGNPTFYTLNNPPYVGSAQYQYGNLATIATGPSVIPTWGTIQTIDPNLKVPYSEQFSFGIQRELPHRLFAEVSYVGTLGRHLLDEPDINQPTFAAAAAVPSTTVENTIRPYVGYSTIQQFESRATSNYHGAQFYLTKRAGNWIFTAGYTFSKNLGNASSDTTNNYDYYNPKQFYGPLTGGLDVRHVFVGTFVWNLPALKGQKQYLQAPFGAWQLSGIIHVQSGQYYTVTGSSAVISGRLADYVGGPAVLPNPGPNGWFNPAAFAVAPQNRWGTAAPGDVEGPGLQIYDLSLTKFFTISEARRINLRVRADFINAFNCVNFQGPDTNISASSFGTITSAYPPRNIQLGLKLQF